MFFAGRHRRPPQLAPLAPDPVAHPAAGGRLRVGHQPEQHRPQAPRHALVTHRPLVPRVGPRVQDDARDSLHALLQPQAPQDGQAAPARGPRGPADRRHGLARDGTRARGPVGLDRGHGAVRPRRRGRRRRPDAARPAAAAGGQGGERLVQGQVWPGRGRQGRARVDPGRARRARRGRQQRPRRRPCRAHRLETRIVPGRPEWRCVRRGPPVSLAIDADPLALTPRRYALASRA